MSEAPRSFQVDRRDNVATMLDDGAAGGSVSVLGTIQPTVITLREGIRLGHKIALFDIARDASIFKFGVPIGRASRDIAAGEWVHLHNCTSNFDQRSQTLDLHTGAATDTKYE